MSKQMPNSCSMRMFHYHLHNITQESKYKSILDSNKFLLEDSVHLGYNAAPLGNWFLTFQRYVISAVLGAVYCGTGC